MIDSLREKFGFKKKDVGTSEFSRFFREASSRERKKVFETAARKATEDQRKIFSKDLKIEKA